MKFSQEPASNRSRLRAVFAPVMAIAALALAASAFTSPISQKKPSFKVEASRGSVGALITFQGKNWPAEARIKITATRAPGTNVPMDFGYVTVDAKGEFKHRATSQCTTNNSDVASEPVTFTAADSATDVKIAQKVDGSSWMCM